MSTAKEPKVSIITTTYNHGKYIREALESFVTQQTDFAFEALIADDGSTDETRTIIAEYAETYPDIIKPLFREKNMGVVPNFLDAMRRARGDYLALCEGDDYWTDPTKLQRQVDFLDKHPDYALCFHPVRVVSEDATKENYLFPDVGTKNPVFTLSGLLRTNFIQTNSVMYRRQDYAGLPDDVLPLDWYLHLYHAQFGRIGFMKRVMSVYRRHPGGMWWNSDRNIDEIWKRYGLAHLALHIAVLGLYGDTKKYREIIFKHITNMFNNLISTDQKYGTQLLHEALQKYPQVVEPFIARQHQEFASVLQQKNVEIAQLTHQVQEKDIILGEREREIARMKSSKFWKMHDRYWQAKSYVTRPGVRHVSLRPRKKD